MRIHINFKAGKSPYWQIVEQIKYAAASGALHPGETLPSIRPLAEQLRLNRNTVAKAYSELEHEGIIQTIPGKGCVVASNHSPLKKAARQEIVREGIDAAIVQAHHLRISNDEFLRLVEERLEAFKKMNPNKS